MKRTLPAIVAPDGTTLPFDKERLERSLVRRGLEARLAQAVASRLEELLESAPEGIPVGQMNPLIGEALLDLAHDEKPALEGEAEEDEEEPDASYSPVEEPTAPPVPPAAIRPRPRPGPHDVRVDPWFAFRRALGLPAGSGAAPSGIAFPAPRVAKTVFANDTSSPRTIGLSIAYSGRVQLELAGARTVELEGIGREVREVEVPPGAAVVVRGVHEPYSVVSWALHVSSPNGD